jgi:hypothetical protein
MSNTEPLSSLKSAPSDTDVERMWVHLTDQIEPARDNPRLRRYRNVSIVAVLTAALVGTGATAYAVHSAVVKTPGQITREQQLGTTDLQPEAQLEAQVALDAAASDIYKIVSPNDSSQVLTSPAADGYAGLRVETNPDIARIDLYWQGPVSAAAQAAIDAHPEVTVSVHEATYSLAQLQSAMAAVANHIGHSTLVGQAQVLSLSPNVDGSGIAAKIATLSAGISTAEIENAVKSSTSVPTSVKIQAFGKHDLELKFTPTEPTAP